MQFIDSATWQLITNFNVPHLPQAVCHNQSNQLQVWHIHNLNRRSRIARLDQLCSAPFLILYVCVCVQQPEAAHRMPFSCCKR